MVLSQVGAYPHLWTSLFIGSSTWQIIDSVPQQQSFYKGHEPVSCGHQGSDWSYSSFHTLHRSTALGHGLPDALVSRVSWHCLFWALASDIKCRDKGFLQPSPNMSLLGLHLENHILKSFKFFEAFICHQHDLYTPWTDLLWVSRLRSVLYDLLHISHTQDWPPPAPDM